MRTKIKVIASELWEKDRELALSLAEHIVKLKNGEEPIKVRCEMSKTVVCAIIKFFGKDC